ERATSNAVGIKNAAVPQIAKKRIPGRPPGGCYATDNRNVAVFVVMRKMRFRQFRRGKNIVIDEQYYFTAGVADAQVTSRRCTALQLRKVFEMGINLRLLFEDA